MDTPPHKGFGNTTDCSSMNHTDGTSRRKQVCIAGAAGIAGSIQTLRIARGEGGAMAIISALSFLVVLVLIGWQLYRESSSSDTDRL